MQYLFRFLFDHLIQWNTYIVNNSMENFIRLKFIKLKKKERKKNNFWQSKRNICWMYLGMDELRNEWSIANIF